MFSFVLFMIGFSPVAFGAIKNVSTLPQGMAQPVYDNGSYYVPILASINYVELYKDGQLLDTYQRNVNFPSNNRITVSDNGSYKIEQFYQMDSWIYEYQTTFTIFDSTSSGDTPTDNPSNDYTSVLNSINSKIDLSNTNLSGALSRLDNVIYQVARVDGSLGSIFALLDGHFNNVISKINVTNGLLVDVNAKMTTSTEPPNENVDDYSNRLDENKPTQNGQSYKDNNVYFSAPAETIISQTMPQATEPQQWDGVETPEAMQAEESLSSESELIKDLENVKDIELTKDQFTKTEEMTEDNNYSADSPLTQDIFSADGEMTKDNFSADGEMTKDNFSNTEQYSKENEMQQTEIYNAIPNNPNLRWKSVNGQFQ